MTDRQFAIQKRRVEKYIDKWRDILCLYKDRFNIKYERQYHSDNSHTVGQTWSAWHYRNHTIQFFLPEVAEIKTDDEVEEAVVHELCHVLLQAATGDASGKSNDQIEKNEYAVQSTALCLIWAYETGKKDAKV